MPLELTGPQFGPLSIAFRSRLTLNQFDRMLKERLDISREDISLGEDYTDILFKVIREANSAGWVYQLVDAARQVRPNESVFVEYAHMLGIGLRGLPETAELQGIIRASNSMLNLATFLSRAGEIVGQVCRVDLQGEGEGTGFLIGPNAVLTSYHVIESIMKNEHSVQE
ncbi:MAG: effector-associated domain EAD1-containing protein, partial [Chloroflexia bacterium]